MKKILLIFAFAVFTALSAISLNAQNTGDAPKTYNKDGLIFNYPTNWELTDQSTVELQQLKLSLPSSSGLIYVTSPRTPISTSDQIAAAREGITDKFIENINQKFTSSLTSTISKPEMDCSEIKGKKLVSTVLRGTYQNQAGTANILPMLLGHRFVNFVFIRNDQDHEKVNSAWKILTESMEIITPSAENLPVLTLDVALPADQMKIIQGKAIKLPSPYLPKGTRLLGGMSVPVKVTIDEKGKVISARAQLKNADKIYFSRLEQAAKESRFTPSYLCGEPVKVTGIINYEFSKVR